MSDDIDFKSNLQIKENIMIILSVKNQKNFLIGMMVKFLIPKLKKIYERILLLV